MNYRKPLRVINIIGIIVFSCMTGASVYLDMHLPAILYSCLAIVSILNLKEL